MKNIRNRVNEAYKLISSLSVSGDAVDVVAVARNHLREAYKELQELEEKKERMANESTEIAVRERDPEDTATAV